MHTHTHTHKPQVFTLCLTKVRFCQHRLLSVLLLSLNSTSWDVPSIVWVYQNLAHHCPTHGRRLPSTGVTAGRLSTNILTCGCPGSLGEDAESGTTCLPSQDAAAGRLSELSHRSHLLQPHPRSPPPHSPPAADVMSLSALAEKQSPCCLYLLMLLMGPMTISSL